MKVSTLNKLLLVFAFIGTQACGSPNMNTSDIAPPYNATAVGLCTVACVNAMIDCIAASGQDDPHMQACNRSNIACYDNCEPKPAL